MKTSPKGVQAIALHEGVVTKAYKDVVGVWTIGVGHTAAAGPPIPRPGLTITRQQAYDILADDLPKYEAPVTKRMGNVPQHVFDGAVSFCYNVGEGNFNRASWVKLYNAGNMAAAEKSYKTWNKADGRVIKGLINRRAAEADLIFRGKYPPGLGKPITDGTAAAPNDSQAVIAYQAKLAKLGYPVGVIDGIRGPKTIAAVKAFQKDHDLVVDGIVGPATRAALDSAIEAPSPPVQPPPAGDGLGEPDEPSSKPPVGCLPMMLLALVVGVVGGGGLIWLV